MARFTRRLSSALLMAALGGCSAQATTDYQGDPLFTMTGRVELQLSTPATQDLVPTLAFMSPEGSEIRFVEAEVSGEFPASFRVDLYTPPPASVIDGFESQDIPGETRHSLGYIVAVSPDRLPVMFYATSLGFTEDQSCDATGCTLTWDATSFDPGRQGTVISRCPPPAEPGGQYPITLDAAVLGACNVVGRTGDPMFISWLTDPMFAGASSEYAVLYLEGPAAPNSYVAHRYGAPSGFAAGYHLLRVVPVPVESAEERQACRDQAERDAVANYSAKHAVPAEGLSILNFDCNGSSCEASAETRGVRGEWYRLMAERGCSVGHKYEPVTAYEQQVSLKVEPGLNFVGAWIEMI